MQPPQSARTSSSGTSAPRIPSARLSGSLGWAREQETSETGQCASSLITKPAVSQAGLRFKSARVIFSGEPKKETPVQSIRRSEPGVSEPGAEELENSQRMHNIRLWYQRLLHYRANPNSLEFSYLVLAQPPSSTTYHPYDLLVVQHDQVASNGAQLFYTMSADGVTQTHGKEVTHQSLDEFERGCDAWTINHPQICVLFHKLYFSVAVRLLHSRF